MIEVAIETSNRAFEGPHGDEEVVRILRNAADKIAAGASYYPHRLQLLDIDGHCVGAVRHIPGPSVRLTGDDYRWWGKNGPDPDQVHKDE